MGNIQADLELCSSRQETVLQILNLEQKLHLKVLVLLWRWWSARNKANAVSFYLMECGKLANTEKPGKVRSISKWKAPPAEYYKVNVGASFYPDTKSGGWGFLARDCNGDFLEAGAVSSNHI
ncbi:hypothetical protein U9M48_025958 [Paspalum notatum var. saurae]|uniref:RNase H type-1 domain-containing protein n=1 Tax=Paspalum notatum var. saurae TaxID=547442 RepID=A0AAQ3TPY2_PASNO